MSALPPPCLTALIPCAGKATAAKIRAELKNVVQEHSQESGGLAPGLAVVLVGDRRDSATYVRMKKKACDEIGVSSFGFDFPESVSQDVRQTLDHRGKERHIGYGGRRTEADNDAGSWRGREMQKAKLRLRSFHGKVLEV